MKNRALNVLAVAIVVVLGYQAQAAPVVIDNFTSGDVDLTSNTGDGFPASADQAGLWGVIGSGDRDTLVTPAVASSQDGELHIESASSKAFLNSGSSFSAIWTFDYGSDTAFDVDATDAGSNTHFTIGFLISDVAGTTVTVTAYDLDSSFAMTSGGAPVGPSVAKLPFATYTANGVDLTHLTRLIIKFTGATGADHQVDFILASNPAIPAPLALPAGLAMLAGLALLRRKRIA